MYFKLHQRKWYCKVIPKALLLTFGEMFKMNNKLIFGRIKVCVLYIHKIFEIQKDHTISFIKISSHWYQVLHESNEIKMKTNSADSQHYYIRSLTVINGVNFQCPESVIESGSWTIIWMRLKFRVFRGDDREEMSTDIVRNSLRSAAAGVPRVPCNL